MCFSEWNHEKGEVMGAFCGDFSLFLSFLFALFAWAFIAMDRGRNGRKRSWGILACVKT